MECSLLGETPVLRLTATGTPDDAAPLVVVAGPETPADTLASRLASSGPELIDTRPLVVVDYRGRTGPAGTCLTFPARRTLDGLADRGTDPDSPELRGDLADTSQSCTDQLQGRELDFGSAGAAEDLERLRQQWDVPGLAVMGIGTGARTALAYAGAHPGRLSLLVLDSPAPADGDQEAAARAALDGHDYRTGVELHDAAQRSALTTASFQQAELSLIAGSCLRLLDRLPDAAAMFDRSLACLRDDPGGADHTRVLIENVTPARTSRTTATAAPSSRCR
ncbi:hypothetical protein BFG51_11025 [Dietzia alimentaria]|nr:hypothetical protein BFG51_11025 [Dietzia alimentaria]